MVHLKSRFFLLKNKTNFCKKLCSSLFFPMTGGRKNKTSALIGCSVSGMTRSHGCDRGVFIKKPLVMQPKNSACPVVSSLTKNHYIRCQSGSIFRQGEASHSPPRPSLLHRSGEKKKKEEKRKTCPLTAKAKSNEMDEVKDLFKSPSPPLQPRQEESLGVCRGSPYQRGIIKFLLTAYCA